MSAGRAAKSSTFIIFRGNLQQEAARRFHRIESSGPWASELSGLGHFPPPPRPSPPIDRICQLLARRLELLQRREKHVAMPLITFSGGSKRSQIQVALGDPGKQVVAAGEAAHRLQ